MDTLTAGFETFTVTQSAGKIVIQRLFFNQRYLTYQADGMPMPVPRKALLVVCY